ncbi:MAG: hypothetical protein V1738_04125 [Patescibacteria group bacterium]
MAVSRRPGTTPAPVGKTIKTDSTHPIVIRIDDTGSMGNKPGVILEKLPVFGTEAAKIAPGYAISFGLVSDGRCDPLGLQIRDFDAGPALDTHLAELYPQCGGGDTPESYGLAAYFDLEHCEIPKAIKPIYILILDAPPHLKVTSSEIKEATGDVVDQPLDTETIFRRLTEKFSVYVVTFSHTETWEKWLDKQHVIKTDDKNVGDIVEILSGILAIECGAYDEFALRSSKRHSDRPDRVSRVSKALKSAADKSKPATDTDGKAVSSKKPEDDGTGKSRLKSKKLI